MNDADGAPISGATIRGAVTTGGLHVWYRTASDPDGRFAVPVVGDEGSAQVLAAGFVRAEARLSVNAVGEVRLARGGRIEGRVVRDGSGEAVGGTTVYAFGSDSWHEPRPVTAGEDGRFEFSGLPAGEWSLLTEGRGWTTKDLGSAREDGWSPCVVRARAGATVSAEIVVVRGRDVRGTVLDARGRPVAGAQLHWLAGGAEAYLDDMLRHGAVATTEDGRFQFDSVTRGVSIHVDASAPGSIDLDADVPPGEGSVDVTLRFPPARWLHLRVLDGATGAPIAGARIGDRWGHAGITGPDGRVRAGPFATGQASVRVRAPEYVPFDARVLGDAATVRLGRGRTVKGRVLMPGGAPAAGALLGAREARVQDPLEQVRIAFLPVPHRVAAADGTFRIQGLPNGTLRVAAARTVGDEDWATSVDVEPGVSEVVLTLSKAVAPSPTRTILRVLDPEGAPVAVADGAYQPVGRRGETFEVDGGSATLEDAKGGGWLEVWGARTRAGDPLPLGPAILRSTTAVDGAIEVRLPREAVIEGVVRTARGGVAGVRVAARAPDGTPHRFRAPMSGSARTDAAGAFRIGGLAEGEYEVTFAVPPGMTAPAAIRVRAPAAGVEVSVEEAQGPR